MKWKHKEAYQVLKMSLGRMFPHSPYYSENIYAGLIRTIPGLKTIDNAKRFVSIFLVNWPRNFVVGVWPSDTELIQIGFDSVKWSIFTETIYSKGNFYLVKNEVDPSEEDRWTYN